MQVPVTAGSIVDPTNMVLVIDRGSGGSNITHSASIPSNVDMKGGNMTNPSIFHSNHILPTVFNHQSSMILNSQNIYGKDSRWLTLEVCREFQRGKCSRSDEECKFAHPADHVEVTNGKVIACFDNLKGRCQRINPPCKYLHPPQHLKEILQHNGRNNLILRSIALQGGLQHPPIATPLYRGQCGFIGSNGTTFLTTGIPGQVAIAGNPAVSSVAGQAILQTFSPQVSVPMHYAYAAAPNALGAMFTAQAQPTLTSATPTLFALNPAYGSSAAFPLNLGTAQSMQSQLIDASNTAFAPTFLRYSGYNNNVAANGQPTIPQQSMRASQSVNLRTDRLEVCSNFQNGVCPNDATSCQYAHPPPHCPVDSDGLVTVCVDFVKGKCNRDSCKYFHPPNQLLQQLKSYNGSHSNNLNFIIGSAPNLPYTPAHTPGAFIYNSVNSQNAALLANNRYFTGMMLANPSITAINPSSATAAAYQNVPNQHANQAFLPPGSIILAPAATHASQTGVAAFFPSTTQFIANRPQSAYQAEPTILASPQQLFGTLNDNNETIHTEEPTNKKATDEEFDVRNSVLKDSQNVVSDDNVDVSSNHIIRATSAIQIGP
ncbi:hypothetical protein GJ496_009919 [Pomphorhynchus laevis]|nr:hypothetical protein GJ496_009919 [Pomphorhynchus laevis]